MFLKLKYKIREKLRDWLGITQFEQDLDDGSQSCDRKMYELRKQVNDDLDAAGTSIEQRVNELMKMPIDFRLAQAKSSLNLLTSFINEIEHDQANIANNINLKEQLRRRAADAKG